MKILYVTTISATMGFFPEHIKMLLNEGHSVEIATNCEKPIPEIYNILGCRVHDIPFSRSPFSKNNIKAYKMFKNLVESERYDIVHTHTPNASMIVRLACRKVRKQGTIVVYTCHGFHFHNSSPRKNWLLYYPVEKQLSKYTDYIITINHEDFSRAKTFYCPNIRYIPGVGVNLDRIKNAKVDKADYKKHIGIPENCIMILSIGEITERKNHEVIIKALGKIKHDNLYYVICGEGPLRKYLEELSSTLKVHTIFLGYRKDIPELCNAADISAFPSRIEGLGLAGIEAMAAGVPLVSSNVHGILDYVVDGKTGYTCSPNDIDGFAKAIEKLVDNVELREKMRDACLNAVEPFDLHYALGCLRNVYNEIFDLKNHRN